MFGSNRRGLARLAVHLLLLCLVGASFAQAVAKKMQDNLTWGAYADYEAMSVAISDIVYRLNQGYLAYGAVLNIFDKRLGITTAPGEIPHIDRMRDARYINDTIRDAISIDQISTVAPSQPLDFIPIVRRDFAPILAEDVGRVDYYRLAFLFFGFKIQSMHYMFFSLLFATTLLFVVGFRGQSVPLSLLAAELVSVCLIINSNLFFISLPSISAYRAISSLAIVPVTHLVFCVFRKTQLRSIAGMTALAQAALFVFVMWSRSSAQWGIIAVFMATLLEALAGRVWRNRHALVVWPAATILFGFLGLSIYAHNALSPAYYTGELRPSHFTWHSAYLGLSIHPRWPYPEQGDAIAFQPAAKYLAVHRPDLPEAAPLTNGYWFGFHDRIVRHLFFKFAQQHPTYMFYLYAWWKPLRFWQIYSAAMQPFTRGLGLAVLLALVSVGGFVLAQLQDNWRKVWTQLLPVSGVVALASYAPNEWAYPAPHVMVDAIWTTNAFLMLLGSAVVAMFVKTVGARLSGRGWKAPLSRGVFQ
ncbi:MAG: hypothetical protein WA268_29050 [Xanthobacteraceae bacterium]